MSVSVLLVEDSPTMRLLLEEIVMSDPRLELAGACSSGEEALEFLRTRRPDVVSMDILLPGIDGLETTRRLLEFMPVPVVVVSATTSSHETRHAIEALHAGALAVLPKPEGPESPLFEKHRKKITDTFFAMSNVRVMRRMKTRPGVLPVTGSPSTGGRESPPAPPGIRIVGIGASTGGPVALVDLLAPLRPGFPLPVLVVQHIAPGFAESFAQWMNDTIPMPVCLAKHGEELCGGRVYIAPDGYHLGVYDNRVLLRDTAPVGVHRPSADVLFESLARNYRNAAAGFILTGMGRDGATGLLELKRAGGLTIGQEESSCAVFGMPKAAWDLGACSSLRTIPEMTQVLQSLAIQTP